MPYRNLSSTVFCVINTFSYVFIAFVFALDLKIEALIKSKFLKYLSLAQLDYDYLFGAWFLMNTVKSLNTLTAA